MSNKSKCLTSSRFSLINVQHPSAEIDNQVGRGSCVTAAGWILLIRVVLPLVKVELDQQHANKDRRD